MNNFSLKGKKIIKEINGFFRINPHKHWIFLLYVFLVFVSILILFSFYLLYKIQTEQVFQSETKNTDTQSLLKENLLKQVTSFQDQKYQKIINIDSSRHIYKDPSL